MNIDKLNKLQNYFNSIKINHQHNTVTIERIQEQINELYELVEVEVKSNQLIKEYVKAVLENDTASAGDATKAMVKLIMDSRK